MANYSMEKEVKEQDRRLKLRDSLRDTTMTQMAALDKKCKELTRKMEQLTENHSKLDSNGRFIFRFKFTTLAVFSGDAFVL